VARRPTAEFLHYKLAIESEANPSAFSLPVLATTDVGVAAIDEGFRYRAVNSVLASTNGVSAEAHIGKTVREILGQAADEFEPRLRQAFGTGESLVFEAAAKLRRKPKMGHWILSYIPVKDANNKVCVVCAIVVEVTDKKELEESLFSLIGKLSYLKTSLTERRRQRPKRKSAHPQPLKLAEQCLAGAMELLGKVQPSALPVAAQPPTDDHSISPAESPGTAGGLYHLSRRESQVLRLLASNRKNKEIATGLGISVRTVEAHRRRVMEKLGLHSMGELIHLAIRHGLVEA